MRRRGYVAAAALLVGCAPRPIVPPIVQALRPGPPSVDPLPWKARAAFDSAVQAADAFRILQLFAPNAFVITATGDTLAARDVIPLYLDKLRHDGRSVHFTWGREGGLESCLGGRGRERLVYTARLTGPDSTTTLAGQVSVLWALDSTGALKIGWIAFEKHEIARHLTTVECRTSRSARRYVYHWRASVSVAPGGASEVSRTPASLASSLRQRGWAGPVCPCYGPNNTFTPIGDGRSAATPHLISAQYQFLPHVVAEVLTGRTPRGTVMGAQWMPNGDYAQTRIWYSASFVAVLLSYERSGFQIGAGPLEQTSQWRMRDSVVPFSTGGLAAYRDTTSSSKAPVGVVGDARYTVLLTSHTFVTLRAQVRRVADAKTPATARFPEVTVKQSSSFVGLVLGLLW